MKARDTAFEIIFCSSDKDTTQFNDYFGHMPWLALPFAQRDAKEELARRFGVRGIPAFIVVGAGKN